MEVSFIKKDFEELNKSDLHGKLCEGVAELFWFNAIDRDDAAFGQTVMMHHHDFFEIHFILGGRIVYGFEKDRAEVTCNTFVIIPAGVPHIIESYSQDMLKASIAVRIDEGEALFKALSQKGCRAFAINGQVALGIEFCVKSAKKRIPYAQSIIKNRIFEILCDIAGDFEAVSLPQNNVSEYDRRLFKAKQFVNDNPNVFINAEELAKYCNISLKQLNRIFEKYENCSVLEYIHSLKTEQTKKLLTESQATLSAISEALGFSSVYYFSRFFSKNTGVSPSEYRERINKEPD